LLQEASDQESVPVKSGKAGGVPENVRRVLDRFQQAAVRTGRDPAGIKLIAVTKTVSPENIREAAACGIRHVGENRLQEALPKREALQDLDLTWHFIGHLQTNKAKKVVENFDWVQCVDRPELAAKLNQVAARPLPVLIEVKLHEEPNKSGMDEAHLPEFVTEFEKYTQLHLRGLMAIPPFFENAEDVRPFFRKLRQLAEGFQLAELSMGMSHDFDVAIEEGATMVRVGTALFGERA
jgi:pyridoxal phosphate enzyme (YggS family)